MEEAVLEKEEAVQTERVALKTHTNILKNNAYTIEMLTKNHATIMIHTDQCERVKESGLIYDGVLLSAATFCAQAAVNEEKAFLIGLDLDLLHPVKDDGAIYFEADTNITSSGKKVVSVVGKINDIVFLQGVFMLLLLDEQSLIK
jgi:acyl-coenzyme A thioesterase PaaI-like protein